MEAPLSAADPSFRLIGEWVPRKWFSTFHGKAVKRFDSGWSCGGSHLQALHLRGRQDLAPAPDLHAMTAVQGLRRGGREVVADRVVPAGVKGHGAVEDMPTQRRSQANTMYVRRSHPKR